MSITLINELYLIIINLINHRFIRVFALVAVLFIAPPFMRLNLNVQAQRVLRDLESNIDNRDINGADTLNRDAKIKNVPVDVKAWVINPVFGDVQHVDVDTLQHGFQGNSLPDGHFGEYNSLGNLGSPRETRFFFDRPALHDFIIVNNMGQTMTPNDQFKFYNTKSPYMNLSYDWCGTKQTGFDNFKAIYTNNVNKRVNFGSIFNYMYGQGYYDNQSTAFFNTSAWASYTGDRYDLHFRYTHYDWKMMENGGITDPAYITDPSSFARSYGTDDIPTWLQRSRSRIHADEVLLNHRYHIGFHKVEGDSTNRHEVFVPVTSVFHAFSLGSYRRRYTSFENQTDFYTKYYLDNDTTADKHTMNEMKNLLGITLHEGFNKYAVAGLSAYVGFRNRKYEMPDTVTGAEVLTRFNKTYKENDVLIGGRLIRTQGTYVHYDVNAEIDVAGDNAGDISVNGVGELNLPLKFLALPDTAHVRINAGFNRSSNLMFDHFHSNNLWWDHSWDAETRTRIGAEISVPRLKTLLKFGIENITNYTYLKNVGTMSTNSDGEAYCTHDVAVKQEGSVQAIMLQLDNKLSYKGLHFDNLITFQTSTNNDVLPLPTLSVYSNLYLKFVISKVLKTELGLEMRYFTKYNAPDYDPITAQFIVQNDNTKESIGNYPVFNAYINFALKKIRFHLTYYHFNQSDGRYFTMPNYPMNPASLRFGVSWNFYD